MRKINLLYIDDEMLFIRTVQRILEHSEWRDKFMITAAYHHYDAELKVKENDSNFDAFLIDYRLEPDSAPDDEINGEELAKKLKNIPKCKNCFFYLLSATDKELDPQFFRLSLDKSSDNLRVELDRVFEEIFHRIKYPQESEEFTDERCEFKGNDEDCKLLRYQINEHLKQSKSLLLCGTPQDISNLIQDIEQKNFIQLGPDKECYIVKNLTASNCNIDNTIAYIKQNKAKYLVIGFCNFDQLEDGTQKKLKGWMEEIGIPVILTCNDLQKCKNLGTYESICEETNIPQLYEIFKNGKIKKNNRF